jgi:putative addiction module component (TIGR02574 family)
MPTLTEASIAELTAQERLTLIAALWDSLSDEQTPVTHAQREELGRRLGSFDKDKSGAVTWDSLRAELRARTT